MNRDGLSKLRDKLLCVDEKTFNLEKTRQWLVLPFISALGYDIMSAEVEPTYVDAKKGYNRFDYLLRVGDNKVAIIKCKSVKEVFSTADIDMLSNAFCDVNVPLAILTDGMSYHLYRKEAKSHFTEKSPFCIVNLTSDIEESIRLLEPFTKDNIMTLGREKITGLCDVKYECEVLGKQLSEGQIPVWLAKTLVAKAKAVDVEPEEAADIMLEMLKSIVSFDKSAVEAEIEDALKQIATLRESNEKVMSHLDSAEKLVKEVENEKKALEAELDKLKRANNGTKTNSRDKRTIELLEGDKEMLKRNIVSLERRLICGGDTKIKLKTPDDVLTDKLRVNMKRVKEEITLVEYLRGDLGERKIRSARVSDKVYSAKTSQDLMCLIIALIIHNKLMSTSDVIGIANSLGIEMYDRPANDKNLVRVPETNLYRKALVRHDRTDEMLIKLLVEANIDEREISIII